MVSIDETHKLKQGGTYEFAFKGLSSDTKPIDKHEGLPIANGSTFIEIDTKNLKYYDEEGGTWV